MSLIISLFPENEKSHKMITRYKEIYEVNQEKTTRLQNSPIIYMQNLLNQE